MATIIKIKNSAAPGNAPSSLEQGEMALNVTDGKLFYGSGSGNDVKEFTGAVIDTGSFAITGSNTFIGNQNIEGVLTISGSDQCSLHVFADTVGGGLSLRDSTTTDDDQVGIGAFGNNLCFKAGGVAQGNMRLLSNGNFGVGDLTPPERLTVDGNISSSGNFIIQGNITASGDISASGDIYGTFQQITGITITSQSWGLTGSIYSASISNANITVNTAVDVIPNNTDYTIVLAAQLLPQNISSNGEVTVFAVNEPTDDIGVTLNLFK